MSDGRLKRIAAINDISGMGKCSLTVALPVISATGAECSCLPTALLSTHTGEFEGWTFRDLTDELLPIARHWKSTGASFDGIYSGYLASISQAEILNTVLDMLKEPDTLYICDPVMADNGEYYANFGREMRDALRDLCRRADVITPNITEAALLSGLPYRKAPHGETYIGELVAALRELCPGVVAITGVSPERGLIGSVLYDPASGRLDERFHPALEGLFYGAGDIFASALAALLVRGASPEKAHAAAVSLLQNSVEATARSGAPRRFGTAFEPALPDYIRAVSELGL